MAAETVTGPGAAEPVYFELACPGPAASGRDRERGGASAANEPMLRRNALWFCRLRWVVVGVLAVAGGLGLAMQSTASAGMVRAPGLLLVMGTVLAVLNLGFWGWTRRLGDAGGGAAVRRLLWAQIVCDLLVLTAVIHGLGRAWTGAPFMYLFHIVLACIAFAPAESLAILGLAAGLHLGRLLAEGRFGGPTPWLEPASVAGPSPAVGLVSLLFVWVVIWYLVSRLASSLRARDHALSVANRQLQSSIAERSQHMLQTTHQMKAPFAAIHAQVQLLLGGYCGALTAPAREVIEKIARRSLVLSRQIQEMLQLANLRSQGQHPPPARSVRFDHLIAEVLARVEPAARQRGVRLERQLEPVSLEAVEDHLTMLVENLVVNAVTYSRDQGAVMVTGAPDPAGGAVLVVQDQGIGIPAAKLPHIFEDYYRTEEAVQHNRGSTGLGLAIVRQVACTHRLAVRVESAPGWGTRFTVRIPPTTRMGQRTSAVCAAEAEDLRPPPPAR